LKGKSGEFFRWEFAFQVRQAAKSLILGAKSIGSGIDWYDATLSLYAPPKRLTDISRVLLSNRASNQSNGSKETEKKSHPSHAKNNKKRICNGNSHSS
jgi:hypothetical protein